MTGLEYRRNRSGLLPPERHDGLVLGDKPLGTLTQDFEMITFIYEVAQRFPRFPKRHIEDKVRLSKGGFRFGIIIYGDVAPYKTWRGICESINSGEIVYEACESWVGSRIPGYRDIHLREMIVHASCSSSA